ncbi:MAG: hypothetical protein HY689_10765 [Chloroflexi bacterium]|nr:hypothetical protein [Chloroflexota bacterium]
MKRMHRVAATVVGLSMAAALLMPAAIPTPDTTLAATTPEKGAGAVTVAKPTLGGAAPEERCLVLMARPVVFELDDDRIKVHAEALLDGEGCDGKVATLFINGHKVAEMDAEDGAIIGGQMIKDEDDAEADGIHVHVLVDGDQTAQVFFEDEWLEAD